jgi:hypothetical protein
MPKGLNRRQFVTRTVAAATGAAVGIRAPAILGASPSGRWGDLTGRFVYDGQAPERKKLKVDKDIECCGKFDIRDESLMVGEDGGLQNVYVYVRSRRVDVCPDLAESRDERVLLDNRDCIFMPHCLTIWTEQQELWIVNSDPVAQNVAFSPLGDRPANIILPPPPDEASEATWTFRRSQNVPVLILCNYHPWESAYILPRDNPYVAISAPSGTFLIEKLPVGKLEFQVWHEKVGYLDTPQWSKGRFEMDIQPGANDLGTIKLSPSLFEK